MYKAGIAGASGYTGYELIKLIHRHPHLEIGWLTGESSAGQNYDEIYPVQWNYPLISLDEALTRIEEVDVVFLCLPHAASMEAVKRFYATGIRVVDLSADFRLNDAAIYTRWYKEEHTAADLLQSAVYGLCEVYREQLKGSRLIAVPGCYPTSINLGLYPLAKAGWLGERIIADSKSGVSGAGRKAKLEYHFVEANENISPYNVGHRHRHIAEVEQVLNPANGKDRNYRVLFSPHLLPVNRGILSTMYVEVEAGVTESQVWDLYAESYANEPFIHLLPLGKGATLAHTVQSNRCAIGIIPADPARPNGQEYIITSSLDNLIKGASGQAIQCFNIAVGVDETAGLI
ncbi:MAG: N-acetyl-gamma-glutamyl-phosphate reductase [Caldilineaceae bacterium]|nr:N-acetyl-gamma-glutamyl-phosphate reductase [Caldilineaceae bacterium]